MGLFKNDDLETLQDLLDEQLLDLYDAEQRILKALPEMAQAANAPELADAFKDHQKQTKAQIARLEKACERIGIKPGSESCDAAKGLISEGEEMVKAEGDPRVKDAGLIAVAQRVEHYEMAGYGTARTLARQLGFQDVAQLLQETLDEEGQTDHRLTALAEMINPVAARA